MHVYIDPTSPQHRRIGLVERLMAQATSSLVAPRENQFTETLAWLLEHSEAFARRFGRLLFAGDEAALAALEEAVSFGARTQAGLTLASGTVVWPDLFFFGHNRTFEALIEVKVDAELHGHELEGAHLLQPDAYAAGWELRPLETQARVRRVSTLTKGVELPTPQSPLRGRDITWAEVRALLAEPLEESVALITRQYAEVIDARILGVGRPLQRDARQLLSAAVPFLSEVTSMVKDAVPLDAWGTPHEAAEHCGLYLKPPVAGDGLLNIWLAVHPSGGKYNLFALGPSVCIRIEDRPKSLSEVGLLAVGLSPTVDLAGYKRAAMYLPLEWDGETIASAMTAAVADQVVTVIRGLLAAQALPHDVSTAAVSH